NRTMSQLGSAVKDRVSHRARAVRQLRAWLRKYL
ncbi:MAG: non-canonical purine NTP pyrophosphatase, partial [Candidatus Omnitrophica bacterium CG11_big_fil_rev_8_21_14_0_20_64_10]